MDCNVSFAFFIANQCRKEKTGSVFTLNLLLGGSLLPPLYSALSETLLGSQLLSSSITSASVLRAVLRCIHASRWLLLRCATGRTIQQANGRCTGCQVSINGRPRPWPHWIRSQTRFLAFAESPWNVHPRAFDEHLMVVCPLIG